MAIVSSSQRKQGKFAVTSLKILVPGLPQSFSGYRLVQLSDFHYGPATPLTHIASACEIAAAAKPDLLLLTGDYVHRDSIGIRHLLATKISPETFGWIAYRREVRELVKSLSAVLENVKAADGTFAVLGNHEHLEGKQSIVRYLGSQITWLTNLTALISRGKDSLQITGIDDLNRGAPNLESAVRTFENDAPPSSQPFFRLLLSHNPDIVLRGEKETLSQFDLILSGHTHGGQFCLPSGKPIMTRTLQRDHVRGLSRHNSSAVYVSSGVGYGLVNLRIFCPPEIVIIELVGES